MRLINADELKANVNNWYDLVNSFGQTNIQLSHKDILAKIDNMPTIEAKPVIHGHFVSGLNDGYIGAMESGYCSECNSSIYSYWNYCPFCGALLDKGGVQE